MAILGMHFGRQVCEALGIEARGVRTIDIHIAPSEVVTVRVQHVSRESADKVVEVLKEYELVPRKDGD